MASTIRPGPVLGREAELGLLNESLERLAQGVGGWVILEGDAGIGKTLLVAEGSVRAEKLGLRVLRAAGHELERSRPFGMLIEALGIDASPRDVERSRIRTLLQGDTLGTGTDPDLAAVAAGPGVQYRIIDAILGLVEQETSSSPVVLVLEDLHWADTSTLRTLHQIRRRVRQVPLLMVVTLRPVPRSAELGRLVTDTLGDGAEHAVLGPLDGAAVDTLVAAEAGGVPGLSLSARVEQAGGNPLFVIELVRALAEEHTIVYREGRAEVDDATLPANLRVLLLRHLSALSPPTVEVLRLGAVLGATFDVAQLALLAKRSVAELLPALAEAVGAGVLDDAGPRLVFRHELIQQAVYLDLAGAIRAGLHVEAGRVLAGAGAPIDQVAEHLVLGATPGDHDTVCWLHAAARKTASIAPGAAVELLRHALHIASPSDPSRDSVLADLAVALFWSGDLAGAASCARDVLSRRHDPTVESLLRLALIQALMTQGRTPEAATESRIALERVPASDAAVPLLRAWRSAALLFMGDLAGAEADATEALGQAEQTGDDSAACTSIGVLCTCAVMRGRFRTALPLATKGVACAAQNSTRAAQSFPAHLFVAMALAGTDRLAEAIDECRQGRRLSEELGTVANLPLHQFALAIQLFLHGEWDDAVAEAEAGFALVEDASSPFAAAGVHAFLAVVAVHRNDLSGADDALASVEADFAASGPQFHVAWGFWARARYTVALGDSDGALTVLENGWQLCRCVGLMHEYPVLGPDLVRLLIAAGRGTDAEAVTREVEEAAVVISARWSNAAATLCRGMVEDDVEILMEAVALLQLSPRPLERARGCEDAAAALIRSGRRDEAVSVLNEALRDHESLSASRDIARVEATLRGLGAGRRGRGPRRRQAESGWESLTRSEVEVVRYVAEGLTSREVAARLFISSRTVDSHLSHVFRKLDVSSRRSLKAEAAQRLA